MQTGGVYSVVERSDVAGPGASAALARILAAYLRSPAADAVIQELQARPVLEGANLTVIDARS